MNALEMVVLPGGLGGVASRFSAARRRMDAVQAARMTTANMSRPSARGRRCWPSFGITGGPQGDLLSRLRDADAGDAKCVPRMQAQQDGKLITGQAPRARALAFGLELLSGAPRRADGGRCRGSEWSIRG